MGQRSAEGDRGQEDQIVLVRRPGQHGEQPAFAELSQRHTQQHQGDQHHPLQTADPFQPAGIDDEGLHGSEPLVYLPPVVLHQIGKCPVTGHDLLFENLLLLLRDRGGDFIGVDMQQAADGQLLLNSAFVFSQVAPRPGDRGILSRCLGAE
jgi:hypothetical protein